MSKHAASRRHFVLSGDAPLRHDWPDIYKCYKIFSKKMYMCYLPKVTSEIYTNSYTICMPGAQRPAAGARGAVNGVNAL